MIRVHPISKRPFSAGMSGHDPMAGAAGVLTLAYASCKTLYEPIEGFHNTPKSLKTLNGDLDGLADIHR
jgi:hypothetical protein